MKTFKKLMSTLLLSFLLCGIFTNHTEAASGAGDVRHVREYQAKGTERFSLTEDSRILILQGDKAANNDTLQQYVQLADAELQKTLGRSKQLPIYYANQEDVQTGDLVINLNYKSKTKFTEEYAVSIQNYVKISSVSERGILYGFRTFSDLAEGGKLGYAEITDYPSVEERALHIDMARKFYTKDWIIRRIKQMSFLKLNTLQMHFSENEGFRIESKSHPEIMSEEYLTQQEVKEILAAAKQYGVEIIPSLDAPGHLKQVLKTHPEFQLNKKETVENEDKTVTYTGNIVKEEKALDITNPQAVAFIKEIYDEYAELFQGSKYFNIGADEFVTFGSLGDYPDLQEDAVKKVGKDASPIDSYIYFVNDLVSHMEAKGFVVRTWSDGFYRSDTNQTLDVKKSVQVDYWTRMFPSQATVQTYIDKGHRVMNFCDKADPLMDDQSTMTASFLYYVNAQFMYQHPTGENIFNYWHPVLFSNWKLTGCPKQEYAAGDYPDALQGASFAVWNDTVSESQEDTEANIEEPLTAMAQKCWNPEIHKAYKDYAEFYGSFKKYKDLPGYQNTLQAFTEVKTLPPVKKTEKTAAPTIKKIAASVSKSGIVVKITVNAVKGADKYAVYRVAKGRAALVGNTDSGKAVIRDTKNTTRNASYYAVALDVSGKAVSDNGAAKKFSFAAGTGIKKTSSAENGIRIEWKKSGKAQKYVIYRSAKKNKGYKKIAIVKKGRRFYVDKKTKKGKTYYYKIVVKTKKGISLMSRPSKKAVRK